MASNGYCSLTLYIRTEMQEIIEYAFGYGFAGLFAILFWRYIRDVQMEQTEKLRTLERQLTRIEDQQTVESFKRRKERDE